MTYAALPIQPPAGYRVLPSVAPDTITYVALRGDDSLVGVYGTPSSAAIACAADSTARVL